VGVLWKWAAKWAVGLSFVILVPSCVGTEAERHKKAQDIWKKHELVVEDAARGRPINGTEFQDACEFFLRVANISVPGDASSVLDWFPTKETVKAVEPLRQWYERNKDQLYWDATKKTVVLKPL